MKEFCGWCGVEIAGEAVSPFHSGGVRGFGNPKDEELLPEFECGFCSPGCAWAFAVEEEGHWGLTGAAVRQHLETEHGLVYASCSRPQSPECRKHFEAERRVMADWMMRLRIARRFEGGG